MIEIVELDEEQVNIIDENFDAYDRAHIGYRLGGSVNIGVEQDGRLIAGLNGYMTAFKILYIGTMFVEEEFRQRGAGTELIRGEAGAVTKLSVRI